MKLEEKPSDNEFISLTKSYCVVYEFQVPRKEGYPGCFNVPVIEGGVYVGEALCDLGDEGNLMSLATFRRIGGLTVRPCFVDVGLAYGTTMNTCMNGEEHDD